MKSNHQLIQTTMVTEPTLLHKQQNSPPPPRKNKTRQRQGKQ